MSQAGEMPGLVTPEKDVCAILVTYHPNGEFPLRLADVSSQVAAVVIVDNGSASAEVTMLREIAANPAVTLVLNGENLGIARALNIGIQRAVALGFHWALLIDQDTRVETDMVQMLLAAYDSFPDKERLAAIGSGFRDLPVHTRKPDPQAPANQIWDEIDWVITSGSLLPLASYGDIGPFRDDFFIDCVDIEYGIRARAKGYRMVKTRKVLMSHSIGTPTLQRFLWKSKWTTNHSADRRYYIARNNTVLLRESGDYYAGRWAVKSFFSCLRASKRIILYEEEKARKVSAIFSGWWDGVVGTLGPRRR